MDSGKAPNRSSRNKQEVNFRFALRINASHYSWACRARNVEGEGHRPPPPPSSLRDLSTYKAFRDRDVVPGASRDAREREGATETGMHGIPPTLPREAGQAIPAGLRPSLLSTLSRHVLYSTLWYDDRGKLIGLRRPRSPAEPGGTNALPGPCFFHPYYLGLLFRFASF